MFDSPIRSSIGTPSQQRISNTFKRILSPARPSFDEENQGNRLLIPSLTYSISAGGHDSNGVPPMVKRNKSSPSPADTNRQADPGRTRTEETTPRKSANIAEMNTSPLSSCRPEDKNAGCASPSSECGTEVSSVAARREWLKNFGSTHREANPAQKIHSSASGHGRNDFGHAEGRIHRKDARQEDEERTNVPILRLADGRVTAPRTISTKPPKTPPRPGVVHKDGIDKPEAIQARAASSTSIRMIETSRVAAGRTITGGSVKTPHIAKGAGAVPIHIRRKNRFDEEVKATDEGYASVAKLSEWLASDPTSTKKKRHVRRGKNVITKSRQFEKDQDNIVIMESNQISRGAVSDKKKWLQNAFHEEDGEDDDGARVARYAKSEILHGSSAASSVAAYYNHKTRGATAFGRASSSDARSEIITNDAASSLSVSDKKDWLKNAFAKKEGGNASTSTRITYGKAQTDVMHNRGESRDEMAARAKMRFKERSARKLMSSGTPINAVGTKESDDGTAPSPMINSKSVQFHHVSDHPPGSESCSKLADNVEEDTAPVDFRAAREALVQRSKSNGHQVQVVNKVYLRKTKFEKLEEANRRKSGAMGRLKASWDTGEPSDGRPSNAYQKKYVQDIAPKKSFDELP